MIILIRIIIYTLPFVVSYSAVSAYILSMALFIDCFFMCHAHTDGTRCYLFPLNLSPSSPSP